MLFFSSRRRSSATGAIAAALGTAALATPATAQADGRGQDRGVELRSGAVFSASNAREGNRIVALDRVGGRLRTVGTYDTGGTGSGSFEDSVNGLITGSAEGEASPNNLGAEPELVFAANSGSDTITVFRIERNRLVRVQEIASGGQKPISLTVNRGRLFVLNSGETVDAFNPPNCASGEAPSITGFRVADSGELTPIDGSTRPLSGSPMSGCAQVSFDPSGRNLVVTERTAKTQGQQPQDEGVIVTYGVGDDGVPTQPRVTDATGSGPFGFTFTRSGVLLTTEQFDGPAGVTQGRAASYTLGDDGALTARSGSVRNFGTDTCWFVATRDGRRAWAVSFFEGGRISTYGVGESGSLRVIQKRADRGTTSTGAGDTALSGDERYLYNVNAISGVVSSYRIVADGGLRLEQRVKVHPKSEEAATVGLASS